jgi:hypothetical protein
VACEKWLLFGAEKVKVHAPPNSPTLSVSQTMSVSPIVHQPLQLIPLSAISFTTIPLAHTS